MAAKKDDRMEIRLPSDLKNWVKEYAKRKNTDLSHIVVTFLTEMREQAKLYDKENDKDS